MADNVNVSVNSSLVTTVDKIDKLTGINMSKWFKKPGTGSKTPSTPKALKVKCQMGINVGLGLPDLPSIYLPKFPPKLPSIPIPTSLPLGPCTVSLDLACLGIPDDLVQVVIKYIIIPVAGGIIPPKTEALARVVGGKIAGVIEDVEEYAERYREIQQILNNLSLDVMFGLDAIPCPDQAAKAKEKAKKDADAAKKREEEGKLTREDIYNKYSEAIINTSKNFEANNIDVRVNYSSIITTRAISYDIIGTEKTRNSMDNLLNKRGATEYEKYIREVIEAPIREWETNYENYKTS